MPRQDTVSPDRGVRIAADVGGTFTDLVLIDANGTVRREKSLSTPPRFEACVLDLIDAALTAYDLPSNAVRTVNHGTTVATNAVLERRGARTALVTTAGFRDVLELRRVRAPQIYDLFFQKPPILVDRYLRLELGERIAADGSVLAPVSEAELGTIVEVLRRESVESVAVCLLHAYAHPQHEEEAGDYLRRHLPGIPVTLSSEVLAERREYERTATTSVNAYVRPVMHHYLNAMDTGLKTKGIDAPLLIMQSAGGLTPASAAALRPVFCLESGPAAGVLAAAWSAGHVGEVNIISFDMGGTTAKAAMIEGGRVPYSAEYEVGAALSAGNRLTGGGGEMIIAPSIDIAEVGAGGGSIAWLDAAGGLRVGPRSAGAVPGPVCYQRGGSDPTVTDANVVLGYIRPGRLAGGEVVVDAEAAHGAIEEKIARPLAMSVTEAAMGIHRIANAEMLRALREVSVQRGRDPRGFTLVAFGGSGPVHAAGLAEELGIRRVMVPPMPGVFSAVGLLAAGVEHHGVRSCDLVGDALTPDAIRIQLDAMRKQIAAQFRAESISEHDVCYLPSVEMRYAGQASQLRIDLAGMPPDRSILDQAINAFEAEHERLYGYRAEHGTCIEVVVVRLIGRAPSVPIDDMRHDGDNAPSAGCRTAEFGGPGGRVEVPLTDRASLHRGVEGPMLIDEYDATIAIPPQWRASTDEAGNLILEWIDAEG